MTGSNNPEEPGKKRLSRRDFLKLLEVGAGAVIASGCGVKLNNLDEQATQEPTENKPLPKTTPPVSEAPTEIPQPSSRFLDTKYTNIKVYKINPNAPEDEQIQGVVFNPDEKSRLESSWGVKIFDIVNTLYNVGENREKNAVRVGYRIDPSFFGVVDTNQSDRITDTINGETVSYKNGFWRNSNGELLLPIISTSGLKINNNFGVPAPILIISKNGELMMQIIDSSILNFLSDPFPAFQKPDDLARNLLGYDGKEKVVDLRFDQNGNIKIITNEGYQIIPYLNKTLLENTPDREKNFKIKDYISKDIQEKQGWDIKWQDDGWHIYQKKWDEATQKFTPQTTHEIGFIDTEGNLHINIIHPSYQKIAENKYQDTSNPQELIVNLKNLSTPTPEAGQETQKPGFELLSTDNPNPLFQKTGGILVFRYLDENGVLRTANFSQKKAVFVDFDLSTASDNLFVWTSEPEVLQTEFPVTHIPWELLHDPSLPITARLITEGFDRDFPEETKAALMGYILRFERVDDGSKVCFLRPALRDQIPDPKNPQKTIKFEVTDEFVDDAVRWAARKDKDGNWERLFFTTIDPKGNKILFTYMQLLDINGNRLFLPLAIGANVPDENMAYFIKDWNTSEDRTPGGNFNSSFFRIIIATEGDYFKELSPGHIFYRMMGPKSRDPLDSLLGMEGNDVTKIKWKPGDFDFSVNIPYWLGNVNDKNKIAEITFDTDLIPLELQEMVFVISP